MTIEKPRATTTGYCGVVALVAITASPALGQSATGPVPQDNPATWVMPQDYPAAALREHHEGSVTFRLDVGRDGRVAQCHVLGSSGFDELDKATCELVTQRARFLPAKNAAGLIVAGHYQNRVRWMIPQNPPHPEAGELVVTFLVQPDGTVSDCSVETASGSAAQPAVLATACRLQKFDHGYTDDAGQPVTRRVRRALKIEILPVP